MNPEDLFSPKPLSENPHPLQRRLTVKDMVKVKKYPFLDKRIVGVFRLEKKKNIIVY